VNADGTGRRSLTTGAYDLTPVWSPDGTRIAFTRMQITQAAAASTLWVMNADGTGQHALESDGHDPSWSPDGSQIAFASNRDRYGQTCFHDCSFNDELYVMRADGTQQTRLTRSKALETSPAWSPDGARIAFQSDRNYPAGQNPEIYLMNPDGGCVTRMSNTSSWNTGPAWQPGAGPAPVGPCGADAPGAVVGLVEVDLGPARRARGPIFFLGTSFRSMLLSHADESSFIYDDCALPAPRGCFGEVQLGTSSICTSHPLRYGGAPDFLGDPIVPRYSWRRGALIARYFADGQTDVHTGSRTVEVVARRPEVVIDALQPVTGSPVGRLAAPAFGERVLRLVRQTAAAYRVLGSVPAVQRALRLTRERVLQRLALGRALRGHRLGPPSRC
jgi:hypothetical protein